MKIKVQDSAEALFKNYKKSTKLTDNPAIVLLNPILQQEWAQQLMFPYSYLHEFLYHSPPSDQLLVLMQVNLRKMVDIPAFLPLPLRLIC